MPHSLKVSLASVISLVVFAPYILLAQTSQDDLRNAIQSSVMTDPRVQEIPPSQLTALIDALVAEAEMQHMSVSDILWQPQRAAVASAVEPETIQSCSVGWQGYLCQLEQVFGFTGSNYDLPIILLVTSGLLIVVLWEFIAHHRKMHAAQIVETVSVSTPAPPSVSAQKRARPKNPFT